MNFDSCRKTDLSNWVWGVSWTMLLFAFSVASQAANLALDGTVVIGVNDAINDDGTARANAGTPANANDGQFASRVDTWFGERG